MAEKKYDLKYEEIPQTADLKIIAYGKSLVELFINAGEGMYQIAGAAMGSFENDKKSILIKGNDFEILLVSYLEELLYLADHGLITFEPELNISHTKLMGTLPLYSLKSMNKEIKAVTYHDLDIQNVSGIFQTKIVFDV